ncbi:conjugation system SOS inhibitor PsiB family protein [Klebsiella michiganensis]|uniref:conjugation system SOS inhibitor PsiB family protein n=1 Tax=Klebsiella michiganensis TaxID=1134687 RepID=UPI00257124FA|nr:conjugation system SOS inhibitor PsiB family protein [Klebsiella michiganensis]MDL4454861.1 conjugation system SOS inhibitor PsiB family protein [Klebsiella michiganensis]
MKNAFKLEKLEAMSADELEQYRDRGREYRVMLNCAVLSHAGGAGRLACGGRRGLRVLRVRAGGVPDKPGWG